MAKFSSLALSPVRTLDYGSFVWVELSGDDYAALSGSRVDFQAETEAGQVQVTRYRFDPRVDGEPALPAGMQASGTGAGFRLVQFAGPVRGEWLAQLAAAGLTPLQYYPFDTYLVWGTAAQASAAEALPVVRWVGAFHPGYKINPDLDGRAGQIDNVDIVFYNDGQITQTLDQIAALGGQIIQNYPSQPDRAFFDAIVRIDARALPAVARLDTVLWLGYASPTPGLEDEMAAQIVAGNHPGGVPVTGYFAHLANLGYDGSGVTWAIIDTGVDYDHPDLGPHIVGGYSYPGACNTNPGEDCSGGGHGTHVAGIVGGDASAGFTDPNGFLYGLGIAPGYGIFASNSLSAAAWPPTGGWQEHTKRAVLGGAIGGNNSWTTGEGTNHGYQASERTHDIMVRDGNFDTAAVAEPFIEVFSAGNSGPGANTLTAPKEGKNLIVIASSVNYRAGNIDLISGFSSRGPSVDGRYVPTVAAPGEQIASTRNDLGGSCATAIAGTNNYYAYCSGTSMAAPEASGAITLFTQWWRTFNGGANPSPAMAKALLVNGAVDMGTPNIPNFDEGWGRINVTNIISPSVLVVYRDQIDTFFATGEQVVLNFGVADPTKPLKITLTWSDAPGAIGANPSLVNNLNLTVVNNSNTYKGNVFSGGWSTTGGGADTRNNLENVYIQNPGGDVTITIDAANISGDGVPYTGTATDQDFALVCSNCAEAADFTVQAIPSALSICTPSDAIYNVTVGSILGYSSAVTLSASGYPGGATAGFSVNPVNPPGTSELTIGNTGAAAAGSYSLDITGTGPTSTHTSTVTLNVYTGVPGAPTLTSPPNFANDVSILPTFQWDAVPNTAGYWLEVSTNASFTNIVYSAAEATTSHTIPSGSDLDYNSTYYWRVRANNTCGDGTYSSTFRFTTVDLPDQFCHAANLGIPDNNPAGATATFTIPANGTLLDVDISLDVTHTWVGDLQFTVSHGGTNVIIFDRPGVPGSTYGCSGGNIANTFDDEGTLNAETGCTNTTPAYPPGTLLIPNNPLSAFDGLGLSGSWSITAVDLAGGDTGTLDEWCVIPTYSSPVNYGVELSQNQAASGWVGTTVTYAAGITNTGDVTDTFDLSLTGQTWTTTLSTASVMLEAGASSTFEVYVQVPPGAANNATDTATVMADSQGDPGTSASTGLTTTAQGPTYGAALSVNQAQEGAAGTTVTYTLSLTNTGNTTDTFALSATGTWTASLSVPGLELAPGAVGTFDVMVEVPAGAAGGASDEATVTATSQTDPGESDSAALTTTVPVLTGVELFGDQATSGDPGTTVTYTLHLTNTGNATDTFDLVVSSTWTATLSVPGLSLNAGEDGWFTVTVEVPAGAAGDAVASVTATSQADAGTSASANLTTTAVPPTYKNFLPAVVR